MVSCFRKCNLGIHEFSSIETKSRHTTTHVVYVIGYTKCTQTPGLCAKSRVVYRFFIFGIWLVFTGIYQTNTGRKLGQYISVLFFGRDPFSPQNGGHGPLFEGPSPHFEEKRVSRQTLKSSLQILQCSKYQPKYLPTSTSAVGHTTKWLSEPW
jgi:hypothetical protein